MSSKLRERLHDVRPLSSREVRATFEALIAPKSSDDDRVSILLALSRRPPSAPELTRFVEEIRRRAVPFRVPARDQPVDLCGSGGARTPSFNVSTVSAFVVAAAGVPVVKHGNRSSRGPCGSSDLLEALGLPVTESRRYGRETYGKLKLAFLHAPLYHPATRAVAAARRAAGVPTLFNQLGPLSNPATITYQLVGVADRGTAEITARVLRNLRRRRAIAVTSSEGCDEFSPKGRTFGVLSSGSRLSRPTFASRDLIPSEDRRGTWGPLPPGPAADEARRILAGGGGARRGAVLLTAGAALWVTGRSRGIRDGIERAREALDSGKAEATLFAMEEIAQRYPREGG
ncbi:MAG TPA: anthranilate phosphoribosyltransferase [Thermoplasmata archaeon]|nr:anthranilate phosphoribosyltransferase [Thermoplasmata archaeon]